MVIGWDGLLPQWLSDLHPRFRTVKALAVVTGAMTAVACLCIDYSLIFSVVLFGRFSIPMRLESSKDLLSRSW